MSRSLCGIQPAHILKPVAANLATMDDADQADFLKTFIHELRTCCGTEWGMMSQLSAVRQRLTKEEREVLAHLGEP